MKQVVDSSGNKINGLFKTESGSFIVNNPMEYKNQLVSKQAINSMQAKIEYLESLINKLIK